MKLTRFFCLVTLLGLCHAVAEDRLEVEDQYTETTDAFLISYKNWFDAARCCNYLENAGRATECNLEVTEHGAYELDGDQLLSIDLEAIYAVSTVGECDRQLWSNRFNFHLYLKKGVD